MAALTRLPVQIVGRVAFQVLAGLTESAPRSAKELYRARPTGWATSPVSGSHETAGDRRPDRDRQVRLALDVAERLGGEIVNADAMQLYRGMDIGTAKLPVGQRRGIPHHQLDVLDVTETSTVARYQQAAAADVEAITARGAVPIIVGGSMLYIQSLLDDWSFPATDPRCGRAGSSGSTRSAWRGCMPSWSVAIPLRPRPSCPRMPPHGPRIGGRRADRSAVCRLRTADRRPRWDTLIIGLDCDTAVLDERLARRTDAMFDRASGRGVELLDKGCVTGSPLRVRWATPK